jgi:hypothetical protein
MSKGLDCERLVLVVVARPRRKVCDSFLIWVAGQDVLGAGLNDNPGLAMVSDVRRYLLNAGNSSG